MFDQSLLKNLAEENAIFLDDKKLNDFESFYEMLIEKNKVMNLTAITEAEDVIKKHFVDSLMILKFHDIKSTDKIADMGTGAGFPGIPLKIACGDNELVLMDSLNKRLKFLAEVKEALSLERLTMVHGRAEDIGRDKNHREGYDIVVSRAVANLSTLSEFCLPLVKEGGYFISYKAGDLDEELDKAKNAISKLGGGQVEVVPYILPGTDNERTMVKIKKIKKTPGTYPRKAGTPAKDPIV